jgi:hypothetical protein
MGKRAAFYVLLVLGIALAVFVIFVLDSYAKGPSMSVFPGTRYDPVARAKEPGTFEYCVAAGNAILDTVPRSCKTPDGKYFTEGMPIVSTSSMNTSATTSVLKFPGMKYDAVARAKEPGTYEYCVAAGNAILDTVPRSCKTSDGRYFTEGMPAVVTATTTQTNPNPGCAATGC